MSDEEFFYGLDLGQSQDPTAECVLRKHEEGSRRVFYDVGHLQRLPLGTRYPHVVNHVKQQMARLRVPPRLVIDYTGVGRPVFDMFLHAGLSPTGVSIHAGDTSSNEGMIYKVPKILLISRVQTCLHSGQLRIYDSLADAPALVEEMQNFRVEMSALGHMGYSARSGKHDDLILSVAIALWLASGCDSMESWGMFEYYRQTYGDGGGGAIDREPSPYPAPQTEPADVVLRAPTAVSAANGLSGRLYTPSADGCFRMTAEDAKVLLLNAGWTRV